MLPERNGEPAKKSMATMRFNVGRYARFVLTALTGRGEASLPAHPR